MSAALCSVRHARTPSRTIVLFSVRSGDRVICETLDALEAIRQRATWNVVTEDFFDPATITMQEFASVGEAVSA